MGTLREVLKAAGYIGNIIHFCLHSRAVFHSQHGFPGTVALRITSLEVLREIVEHMNTDFGIPRQVYSAKYRDKFCSSNGNTGVKPVCCQRRHILFRSFCS